MLTSTPMTAKCEPGFSAMNHLNCNLRTTLVKNTLSDLMQMHSSDHAMKAYRPNSPITNCFSGAKTNRHILIFKLTTGIPKLSANLFMMFTIQLFYTYYTWQTIESLKQYQLTMFCITRLDYMTVFGLPVPKILM